MPQSTPPWTSARSLQRRIVSVRSPPSFEDLSCSPPQPASVPAVEDSLLATQAQIRRTVSFLIWPHQGNRCKICYESQKIPRMGSFLVLDHLAKAPFESLSELDISALTKKTVFLVILALGRRFSEVSGLSGLPSDIAKIQDGSYVLKFLPEFLAKNQNPSSPLPQ